jgi:hypothetical protein
MSTALDASLGQLTLGQLSAALLARGSAGLDQLVGSGPVYVVRLHSQTGDPLLFNTPSDGIPLPDTNAWHCKLGKTASGEAMLPWAGFEPSSPVVAVAKSDRNPFLGVITVGRAANNDLRLASKCVSKLHAFVKECSTGWKVQDSDSSNGTFVNHVRVAAKQDLHLRYGDELRFADVTGMFLDRAGLETLLRIIPSA